MSENTITLPTSKIKAESQNPKGLVIAGKPKSGKTTAVAHLDDCLLIDLEDGARSVDAMKVRANSLEELQEICQQIYKSEHKYKYIAIDTVTKLEEWCEWEATEMYMKTTIGKKFNRDEMGNILPRRRWDSVLTLPKGAGYYYLRECVKKWYDVFDKLCDNIILIAHIKDKFVEENGKEFTTNMIDLTGKLAGITAQRFDSIGFLYTDRKTGDQMISFDAQTIEGGSRQKHLKGQSFKFFEYDDNNEIKKVNWDKIYIE